MDDEINGWNIGRAGQTWTGPEGLEKLDRPPGRLEMAHGKLCLSKAERLTLLAGLLENVGIDEVVKLGKLEDWQQAVAALGDADAERELSDSVSGDVPERYRKCRVIASNRRRRPGTRFTRCTMRTECPWPTRLSQRHPAGPASTILAAR